MGKHPMTHEFQFEPDANFVYIRCRGTATAAGYAALDRDLIEHPLMKKDIDVLFDERELDLSEYSAEDVRANAEHAKSGSARWGNGRWAFVAETDLGYGVGRMWEMQAEDGIAKHRIFRSIDEAREWLGR
jgi:hypothetical protein